MSETMMRLGEFVFSVKTAAYQELEHSTAWRWARHDVIGQAPTYQYVGPDKEEITLSGLYLPHLNGNRHQIEEMKDMIGGSTPLNLVSGTGDVLGKFIVLDFEESHREFSVEGVPLQIDFSLTLEKYQAPNPPLIG